MSNTLNRRYVDTSISEGTMRPEDLIPVFLETLKSADRSYALELREHYDVDTSDPDEQAELLASLFEALNEVAPEGCYFGSHEGDGACYGFWSLEDDIA